MAILTRDLRVDYGDTVAVRGIDLEVPRGEIFGLVGPNGAGKTSTFRVLATLMQPTYGDVFLCGIDAMMEPAAVRHRIAYMPDLAPLPSDLRCGEFLDMFAAAHGMRGTARRKRVRECLEAVQLEDKRQEMCRSLSRGMSQRLVLAKSILHRPEILILDEPASGMDPVSRADLRTSLRTIADDGRTVIVSSHILSELADMCTSVGLMREGDLVDSGPLEHVVDRLGKPQREITVRFLSGVERAVQLLRETVGAEIERVMPEVETVVFQYDQDPGAQADLIEAFIGVGCRLRSFEERQSTIEDIFLNLGSGSSGAVSGAASGDRSAAAPPPLRPRPSPPSPQSQPLPPPEDGT